MNHWIGRAWSVFEKITNKFVIQLCKYLLLMNPITEIPWKADEPRPLNLNDSQVEVTHFCASLSTYSGYTHWVSEHSDLLTGVLMSHLAFIFHHTLFTQQFKFATKQLSRPKKTRLLFVNSFAYIFLHNSTSKIEPYKYIDIYIN